MVDPSLATARKVVQFLNGYRGPLQLDALLEAAIQATGFAKEDVLAVLDFINELRRTPSAPTETPSTPMTIDATKPLNLMDELHYNYLVAKRLLEDELKKGSHDTEEVRKNLREISRFMESALKLQERLYNVQAVNRFQDAVLELLDTIDPSYRRQILDVLLEADL